MELAASLHNFAMAFSAWLKKEFDDHETESLRLSDLELQQRNLGIISRGVT